MPCFFRPSFFRSHRTRVALLLCGLLGPVWSCVSTDTPASTDAGTDLGVCDPACHWDCFGGFPTCAAVEVTFYGYGPRPCCGPGAGTYDPSAPVCATGSSSCASGSCGAVDPRYAGHLATLGSFNHPLALPGPSVAEDAPHLLCARTVTPVVGSPCSVDGDCRPAPVGVAALRCDTSSATPTCIEVPRPAGPANYGASCGLAQAQLDAQPVGEHTTLGCGTFRTLCQTYNDGAGCTAQRCTVSCMFDEDCPDGSVCLSLPAAVDALPGYCAPATDRSTAPGRFGPTGCP